MQKPLLCFLCSSGSIASGLKYGSATNSPVRFHEEAAYSQPVYVNPAYNVFSALTGGGLSPQKLKKLSAVTCPPPFLIAVAGVLTRFQGNTLPETNHMTSQGFHPLYYLIWLLSIMGGGGGGGVVRSLRGRETGALDGLGFAFGTISLFGIGLAF